MAKKPAKIKSKVIKRSPPKVEVEVVKKADPNKELKEALTIIGILAAVILGMYLLICGVPSFI